MGEIADDVLNGLVCQFCGCWLETPDGEGVGYPRTCVECGGDTEEARLEDWLEESGGAGK